MSESNPPVSASTPASPASETGLAPVARAAGPALRFWIALGVLLALLVAVVWWLDGRLYATQAEVARRLQATDTVAVEARTLAQQSAEGGRDLNARLAVLESHEQDVAAQRQQLQQLYQDFAKSRDDAFLGQTAELIALAQQQAELTGSLTPLTSTLEAAAQRLGRAGGPRAALVQHAAQSDLQRLKSSLAPDIPAAAQRLDELAALVDDLQLLSSAAPLQGSAAGAQPRPEPAPGWTHRVAYWGAVAWDQARQLVSVTRIDGTDNLLMAPQQADYLRENLKLRVLNARLDLLSRNAAGYRNDLRAIDAMLRGKFNLHQARTQFALTLVEQAAGTDLSSQPAANLQSLAVLSSLGLGSD
jgi:uncharacterized protein HemX